jgi:hypothetical protein
MRRSVLFVFGALIALATGAEAQGLRDKIGQLFIFGSGEDPLFLAGSADPNNPASIRAHGTHFVPSAVSQNGSIIAFITNAISANVSNAPVGSTSSGETFRFEGGVPVRTSTSAGPILAERALTLGRGRSLVGIGRSTSHFSSLRGVDLDNIDLFFTHQNVNFAGCDSAQGGDCSKMGFPLLENDIMQFKLSLDVNVEVTSIYATYGLYDNMDVGIMLPLVSTRLRGGSAAGVIPFGGPTAAHFFAGTPTAPELAATRSVEGSSFGLGDVAIRAKVRIRETPRAAFALLGDARFATGNDNELLGSGDFAARGLMIFAAQFGSFSPHGNVGYIYRGGATQNDAVTAIIGFDDLMQEHVTIAAELISELQVGKSNLTLPPPVQFNFPFKRTITPTSIPDVADDIVNGSLGLKYSTNTGFTFVTNALVPLNRGGLRANLTYTFGLEYAF